MEAESIYGNGICLSYYVKLGFVIDMTVSMLDSKVVDVLKC